MTNLFGAIRYALRQFRASPVFTTAAILTLAIGIGGTTAIFTLIHAVMLRSLPVARTVLAAVWPDPAWSGLLKNLVVCAVKVGEIDQQESGFLRDVDAKKGIGIVDLDGETQWIQTESVALPHPILLEDLNDFRELSVELGFDQALDQLFRQT